MHRLLVIALGLALILSGIACEKKAQYATQTLPAETGPFTSSPAN